LKIFFSIIEAIAIFVMNMLIRTKGTANQHLCDNAVFPCPFFACRPNFNFPIEFPVGAPGLKFSPNGDSRCCTSTPNTECPALGKGHVLPIAKASTTFRAVFLRGVIATFKHWKRFFANDAFSQIHMTSGAAPFCYHVKILYDSLPDVKHNVNWRLMLLEREVQNV